MRRSTAQARVPRALPLFVLGLTTTIVLAGQAQARQDPGQDSAAPSQAEAREQSREQARQRAKAQAERRAQAREAQVGRAQSKLTPTQEESIPAETQARAQAQARKNSEAHARRRERAQDQARPATGGERQVAAAPDQAQRQADREREADRVREGLQSRGGSIQTQPDTEPDPAYWDRDPEPEAASRHPLQNPDRRAGSIARGQAPEGGPPEPAPWDSLEDRYAHPDTPHDWGQARRQIDQSIANYGAAMRSTPVASRSTWGGYWVWDRGRTRTWVSDDRPYRPANNEFYAVDARRAAAAARDRASEAGQVADPGVRLAELPSTASELATDGDPLYYDRGVFFRGLGDGAGYEVIEPPIGTIVPTLPGGYDKVDIQGTRYNVFNGVYYKSVYVQGDFAFQVAQVDG